MRVHLDISGRSNADAEHEADALRVTKQAGDNLSLEVQVADLADGTLNVIIAGPVEIDHDSRGFLRVRVG